MTGNDDKSLEQKAFDDLDTIAELANAGVTACKMDYIDGARDVLKEIESIAESWEDPD